MKTLSPPQTVILEQLAANASIERELKASRLRLVRIARDQDITFRAIGTQLGVTPEAVIHMLRRGESA